MKRNTKTNINFLEKVLIYADFIFEIFNVLLSALMENYQVTLIFM